MLNAICARSALCEAAAVGGGTRLEVAQQVDSNLFVQDLYFLCKMYSFCARSSASVQDSKLCWRCVRWCSMEVVCASSALCKFASVGRGACLERRRNKFIQKPVCKISIFCARFTVSVQDLQLLCKNIQVAGDAHACARFRICVQDFKFLCKIASFCTRMYKLLVTSSQVHAECNLRKTGAVRSCSCWWRHKAGSGAAS